MIDASNITEGFYYIKLGDGRERIAYLRPNGITARCFMNLDEFTAYIVEIRGPIIFDQLPIVTTAKDVT